MLRRKLVDLLGMVLVNVGLHLCSDETIIRVADYMEEAKTLLSWRDENGEFDA